MINDSIFFSALLGAFIGLLLGDWIIPRCFRNKNNSTAARKNLYDKPAQPAGRGCLMTNDIIIAVSLSERGRQRAEELAAAGKTKEEIIAEICSK
jgi:lipopolysaccharide export LptBFGC system permease protein LptF